MPGSIRDIGNSLVTISWGVTWGVTILAILAAFILYLSGRKKGKEFKQLKEEDFKTILSLMKEKEELMKEKETLKGEILQALDSLSRRESADQDLLMQMVKQYEENESQRREDLTNWLEFKAKKWQDQLEASLTSRLSGIQMEINKLNERISRIEISTNFIHEKELVSKNLRSD